MYNNTQHHTLLSWALHAQVWVALKWQNRFSGDASRCALKSLSMAPSRGGQWIESMWIERLLLFCALLCLADGRKRRRIRPVQDGPGARARHCGHRGHSSQPAGCGFRVHLHTRLTCRPTNRRWTHEDGDAGTCWSQARKIEILRTQTTSCTCLWGGTRGTFKIWGFAFGCKANKLDSVLFILCNVPSNCLAK